ncbi:hypothetical protein VTH82DRAFT_3970 [Thermothelomyces myriococcoides]
MPATEIITIINNSGKVISTGKQLVGIFKEAQAAYRDRREAVKAQRGEPQRGGVQRAKTFDVARGEPLYEHTSSRRRSHDDSDTRSHASSRTSRHSRRSRNPRAIEAPPTVPEGAPLALTEGNLKAHSEISATAPSRISQAPPTETPPRELVRSRTAPSESGTSTDGRRQLVHRPRSDPVVTKKKSIDMNLAYGDIPPDLESRVDLDPDSEPEPAQHEQDDSQLPPVEDPQEAKALSLMDRIEQYLEEAHCVQKTASGMIENLQKNPDAAAAVALSLAELSSLVGKLSPGFLAFLKGGSPAVFALLASPQFLIGTSIALGVTVIMFGGWKIIKRIASGGSKTLEAPIEMCPAAASAQEQTAPAPAAAERGVGAAEYDEALALNDVQMLSSIETWRRGIVPFEGEGADLDEISREAERALQEQFNQDLDEVAPCDSVSQVSWAPRERSSKKSSSRSHRASASRRYRESRAKSEVSDRKSSAGRKADHRDGAASEAASERSHRSHRSSRSYEGSTVSKSSRHSSRAGSERGGGDSGSAVGGGKPKEKKRDMIKQLFKMKKDKEDRDKAVSVMI